MHETLLLAAEPFPWSTIVDALARNLFWVGAFSIAIIWIIAATVDSVVKNRQRETTKREVAAYVAEGSMSADDAHKILTSGKEDESGLA